MMKKKWMALALAVLTLLPTVAACGGNGNENTVTTTTAQDTTVADTSELVSEETTEGYDVKDNLPDNLNYNDATITILSRGREWCKDEVSVAEMTGDVIGDAVYERNTAVEERLGVKIVNKMTTDTDNYTITEEIRKQVQSGSDDYTLFANSVYATIMYTADNLFQDMTQLTYLDLEQPYWSQGFNKAASIGDAQYFATGAICLSTYRFTFATFFNKNMFDERQIPYLYDVVNEGKWTIDYQRELTQNIYDDLNGDSNKDAGDRYGFITNGDQIGVDPYWSSCELDILVKDVDNYLTYGVNQERISTAVTKINQLLWDNEGAYSVPHASADSEQETIASMFAQDQAATVTLRLIAVESEDMRNMSSQYGIVPIPKLEEEQTTYYSYVHDTVTAYGIPLTTVGDELEMVGAFLEALAAESYRTVMPAYYELALKVKYVSDEESVEMLDLIMDNLYVDPGILYTKKVGSFHQNMRTWIGKNNNNVVSQIKATEKIMKTQIEKLNETIGALQ